MIKGEDESRVVPMAGSTAAGSRLPYVVELWDILRREPERLIARAASASLARAIFDAASREHLDRRIVLRRGSQVLSDTHPD